MKNLNISDMVFIDGLSSAARRLPKGLVGRDVYSLIPTLRNRLHITQAQLARRTGLPQSHIAKIESGRTDAQLSTLVKIFRALYSDLFLLPMPQRKFDRILKERIREVARQQVRRLVGSMSLEKQRPDRRMIQKMIQSEEEKLWRHPSSDIWEEA